MLNLLRMDLHRLKKSKSTYIVLGILLATIATIYFLFFLMILPSGQAIAVKLGMMTLPEIGEAKQIFMDVDILLMFKESCMDGGFYSLCISVLFAVFVCADFKNGFIKNIMSVHVNRWNYIGSKMLSFGIVNFIYLVVLLLFTILMNVLIGGVIPASSFSSLLFYLIQAWVLTMAVLGLTLMVCMLTLNITAGILTAVFISSGVIVTMLWAILGLFGANGWLNYSLYMSLSNAKSVYQSPADLSGLISGVCFLVLYTVISGAALKKKDI